MNLVGWVGGEVDGAVGGGPRKALRRMQQIWKALHKDWNPYPALRAAVKSRVAGDTQANAVPIQIHPWPFTFLWEHMTN